MWEVMSPDNWKIGQNNIFRKADRGFDAAFAQQVLTEGKHEVTFTILDSPLGCVCQYLGVCDAAHVHKYKQRSSNPNVEEETVAWAFAGSNGYLWVFRSPHEEYSSGVRKHLMPKTQNLAHADKAKRATVKLVVDMETRRLAFQVNKEPMIDADVELPATGVRPFILLSQKDTIGLKVKRVESAPAA
mmetsp:Transcript_54786/g.90789  ORF Transcript_54786/g.90789 Transcript_54786/m.90789 type:complete len:187 (+) Transcript_54786:105-665(+)